MRRWAFLPFLGYRSVDGGHRSTPTPMLGEIFRCPTACLEGGGFSTLGRLFGSFLGGGSAYNLQGDHHPWQSEGHVREGEEAACLDSSLVGGSSDLGRCRGTPTICCGGRPRNCLP